MGPRLSVVPELAGWQTLDDADTWQTCITDDQGIDEAHNSLPLDATAGRSVRRRRKTWSAGSNENMECDWRGNNDLTRLRLHSPPALPIPHSHLAFEEYKQNADRILKDFARFEWPKEVEDDASSSCPSWVASEHSLEESAPSDQLNAVEESAQSSSGAVQEQKQRPLLRQHTISDLTIAELKASASYAGIRSIDPDHMQYLREADRRWSGPSPGYVEEIYGPYYSTAGKSPPEPTRLSDIIDESFPQPFSSPPSEQEANKMIDALDRAFLPTLRAHTRARSENDLSQSDSNVSSVGSTGSDSGTSWQTAADCGEGDRRRHSLVISPIPRTSRWRPGAVRGMSA